MPINEQETYNPRGPLIVRMMMFGRYRSERVVKDDAGKTKTIIKNGKKVSIKKKVWIEHVRGVDQGFYPSVNHIYVNMAKGRKRLSDPAEDLKQSWETEAQIWANDNLWDMTKDEKVVVELTAYFPKDKTKRDTHNVFKLMLDAFEGILYENDTFVLPRVMDFHTVKEGEEPYFEINVYKKEEEHLVGSNRYSPAS